MKLKPSPKRYEKHISANAVFGAVTVFPDSYLVEDGIFPDQITDNRPNSCTRYAIADAFKNLKNIDISGDFQYMKTCEAMGQDGGEVSLDTALKIPVTVGTLPKNLEPESMPSMTENWAANDANWPTTLLYRTEKQNPAVPIIPLGQDWFDAIRSAMVAGSLNGGRVTVVVGTRWSPDFESIGQDGVLPDTPKGLYWGHCYEVIGWEQINGQAMLVIKSWQGTNYGKSGYCFMSRVLCNKLMSEYGTKAVIFPLTANPAQAKLDLLEILIKLLTNLLYSVGNVGHTIAYDIGLV